MTKTTSLSFGFEQSQQLEKRILWRLTRQLRLARRDRRCNFQSGEHLAMESASVKSRLSLARAVRELCEANIFERFLPRPSPWIALLLLVSTVTTLMFRLKFRRALGESLTPVCSCLCADIMNGAGNFAQVSVPPVTPVEQLQKQNWIVVSPDSYEFK